MFILNSQSLNLPFILLPLAPLLNPSDSLWWPTFFFSFLPVNGLFTVRSTDIELWKVYVKMIVQRMIDETSFATSGLFGKFGALLYELTVL